MKRQRRQQEDTPLIRPVGDLESPRLWQIRIWLPASDSCPSCSVNCGVFSELQLAVRARDKLLEKLGVLSGTKLSNSLAKGWQHGLTALSVYQRGLLPLIKDGVVPGDLLPLWVKKATGGFAARQRYFGKEFASEVCGSAEAAHGQVAKQIAEYMRENGIGKKKRRRATLLEIAARMSAS